MSTTTREKTVGGGDKAKRSRWLTHPKNERVCCQNVLLISLYMDMNTKKL